MKDKMLKICVLILFLNLPILDILRATSFKDVELFGFAVIELVNIILIGIAFLLTLTRSKKKNFLWIGIYFVLFMIYFICHYYNMLHFDTNIYAETEFNLLRELFYIFRAYLLPVLLLFILIINKDIFNKHFYAFTVKYLIAFISFSIIILDFLNLSYPSYDDIVDLKYAPSIFHYLNYSGDPQDLLAKGWFDSANEISVILFALLPINIFLLLKEKKKHNLVLFISQLFAMLLLGTRTSSIGCILITFVCLILYLFFITVKKNKFDLAFFTKLTIVFCLTFVAFIYAPFRQFKREVEPSRLEISNEEKLSKLLNTYQTDEERAKAISDNLYEFGINPLIEEVYPIEKDLEFWLKIAKRDLVLNNDNRIMKRDVIGRIKMRNHNFGDDMVGMGFTLNFMDVEQDYIYQYYLFGFFGLLLLIGIYFLSYIKSLGLFFKDFKNKFRFEYVILFMPSLLELIVAYFTGHTFGMVTPMFVLSLTLGFMRIYMVGDKLED